MCTPDDLIKNKDSMLSAPASPNLAVAGSFSIDGVIAQDGRWVVGKVGGNALWSSLGALMCGLKPRVLTVVGNDYPAKVLETLSLAGIDTRAVVHLDRTHPVRVTFAHMPDGSRIQPVPQHMIRALPEKVQAQFIDTTSQPDVLPLGAPRGEDVPDDWLDEIDFWHLPLLPLNRHRSLVQRIAAGRGQLQADCPARSDLLLKPFEKLSNTLGSLDVFLPSTSDFDVFAPDLDVVQILTGLRAAGARTVVLKAGPDGVYVLREQAIWHIPAYAEAVFDPTGAGDAFCGGFLGGMALTGDLVEAAALGSAVASFAVATEDPLTLADIDAGQTFARADHLRARAKEIGVIPGFDTAPILGGEHESSTVVNE